jgi:hypothetical protein
MTEMQDQLEQKIESIFDKADDLMINKKNLTEAVSLAIHFKAYNPI